jgi:hypothetical protein
MLNFKDKYLKYKAKYLDKKKKNNMKVVFLIANMFIGFIDGSTISSQHYIRKILKLVLITQDDLLHRMIIINYTLKRNYKE